ncbi:MAG: hypothetical protein RSC40_05530 [Clostridia bacterium]
MKKLVSVLLIVLFLVPTFAFAEVDLSGMSFDELVALKDQINKAIWESDTWQEVTVPQGVYVVGDDIPEGNWNIKATDGLYMTVKWGDKLDVSGTDTTYEDASITEYEMLVSPSYKRYKEGQDKTEVNWDLKKGQYIIVDEGSCVFSPYSGKPSLGFK